MSAGRADIPLKGMLLIKEVKSASHSTHGGNMLTRHYSCCGDNNGVCQDPVAPMVLVTLLVFAGTHGWCNALYAHFQWLV